MNRFLVLLFSVLQLCAAQSAVNVYAAGGTPTSAGVANGVAFGDKATGTAQVIAAPGFVSATAQASASSKKHHKPPPKKHDPPPPKKHDPPPPKKHDPPPPKKHTPPPKKHTPPPKKHTPPPKKHFPPVVIPKVHMPPFHTPGKKSGGVSAAQALAQSFASGSGIATANSAAFAAAGGH